MDLSHCSYLLEICSLLRKHHATSSWALFPSLDWWCGFEEQRVFRNPGLTGTNTLPICCSLEKTGTSGLVFWASSSPTFILYKCVSPHCSDAGTLAGMLSQLVVLSFSYMADEVMWFLSGEIYSHTCTLSRKWCTKRTSGSWTGWGATI